MKQHNTFLTFAIIGLTTGMASASFIKPMSFPKTSNDAAFTTQVKNKAVGYEPFRGKSAYQTLKIETQEEYIARMVSTAEYESQHDLSSMTISEYCDKYPLDDKYCPQTPELFDQIASIGDSITQAPTVGDTTTTPPKPGTGQPPQPVKPTQPVQPVKPTQPGRIVGHSPSGVPVIASSKIHDGPCTPSQRSKHFVNKIYTTGQYEYSDPAFDKAMATTFRTEGECGNDPDDTGGYTCYGISQRNNPEVDVRTITRADAERIGHEKYYTRYGIEKLPDNSRGNVFMLGWAGGTITGIHRFCDFLGIEKRNKIDETIVAAAENYPGDIHNDFLDNQQEFYKQVAKRGNNKKFLKGWMNRVRLMRENGCHTPTTDPLMRE